MNALLLQETKGSPKVEFYPSGDLLLHGRSIPLDPVNFYEPLIRWAEMCACENIVFTIRLYYINTSSSKQLFSILKILKEKPNVKQFKVNWYYDDDDDDAYDIGREMEFLINMSFNFQEYAEILE